ncbi:bifunctional D-cysteine desulfhydrase/1-aminocyclopropane-1-carboxylate deaminase, mitochondrial-like [Melia azedarach]|uniref:Bifunctional D-cysteine desulfhydrase/1-aminocyclopropane-1-carboxylate deaminase, mitochondrial-like n=1 Tax=Melia azedarach TaxID=155640 RepID=A0ACC1XSC5_MELAZ|nr:bifunctional D-cysteine desulfhydrase/1-aminocyclopropane-1-carboxylate deaminase, mitochondrial-like [Melia azedarach]
MADALAQGADCIITFGSIQSNHCCTTAVAAKHLSLDSYLILCTSKGLEDQDPGLTGNLLVDRLVGAHIQLVSEEVAIHIGSATLINILKEKLEKEGRRPYVIPAGGSNSLGIWGYIEATREIEQQLQNGNGRVKFDDIVVPCGSGGTAAGLALGSWLGTLKAKVRAFSIYEDPDYLYDIIQDLLDEINAGVNSRDVMNIQNAKGVGYAISTSEELNFYKEIAATTGVIFDPVYSGKAAYGMVKDMAENPKNWEGRKVLFIHTGGFLGLFDRVDQLVPLVKKCTRMDVQESVLQKDGIGKIF